MSHHTAGAGRVDERRTYPGRPCGSHSARGRPRRRAPPIGTNVALGNTAARPDRRLVRTRAARPARSRRFRGGVPSETLGFATPSDQTASPPCPEKTRFFAIRVAKVAKQLRTSLHTSRQGITHFAPEMLDRLDHFEVRARCVCLGFRLKPLSGTFPTTFLREREDACSEISHLAHALRTGTASSSLSSVEATPVGTGVAASEDPARRAQHNEHAHKA